VIGSVQIAGSDALDFDTELVAGRTVIAPRSAASVRIWSHPLSSGLKSARLLIFTNDLNQGVFSVALSAHVRTYLETWRLRHTGSDANSGIGANAADLNSNGMSNLLEFALGLPAGEVPRPSQPITPYEITRRPDGSIILTFSVSTEAEADGFIVDPEFSPTCEVESWSVPTAERTRISLDPLTGQAVDRVTYSPTSLPDGYFRLTVKRASEE
jgi:hypothetical protein